MTFMSTRMALLPIATLLGALAACSASDASDTSDTSDPSGSAEGAGQALSAAWDSTHSYLGQDSAW